MFKHAITDRSIVPYGPQPPALGAAGSVVVDPFAGNRILRVTDRDSDLAKPGGNWLVPSASVANPWAADSSAFVVGDQGGGWWLYEFRPDTLEAHLVRKTAGFTQFSWSDPNRLYGVKELTIQTWDRASDVITEIVDLKDYAEELGIPDSPRWYIHALSFSADDRRVACYLGPNQDKGEVVAVWDEALGLAWLRGSDGEFGGWNAGRIPDWPQPLLLHDVRMNKSGTAVKLGPQNTEKQAVCFWQPGSAVFCFDVQSQELPVCLGHQATGFNTWYGADLTQVPFRWVQAPIFAVEQWQDLMDPVPEPVAGWWSDWHISVCPDLADRQPLFVSTANVQANPTDGSAPTAQAAGDNEILALAPDGSGRWWRLAHHYSSSRGYFYATPRGCVSPDRRFFMFNSDWQVSLGGTSPQQRVDVFVLELLEG